MKKIPIKTHPFNVQSKEVLQELGRIYKWYEQVTNRVYYPPGFFVSTGVCANPYGIVANGKWYGKNAFWTWLADGMPTTTEKDMDYFSKQNKIVDNQTTPYENTK